MPRFESAGKIINKELVEPYLYIGKVAQIPGASRKIICLDEEMGLMPAPARRGNYRVYSERDAFLVHVLECSQSFGFKLSEMKELVSAKASAKAMRQLQHARERD